MMRRLLPILLTAAAVGCWLSGCNTSGCVDNRSAIPLAGFYSDETEQAISLSAIEIGGVGAPNDTLLVSNGERTSIVYLPFRSTTNATAFYIHYTQEGLDNPAFNDTIWFEYTSLPQFVSQECGAMYFYEVTSMEYTTHVVRRVELTDPTITNVNTERIRIYYSTARPGEEEQPGEEPGEDEEEPGEEQPIEGEEGAQ